MFTFPVTFHSNMAIPATALIDETTSDPLIDETTLDILIEE